MLDNGVRPVHNMGARDSIRRLFGKNVVQWKDSSTHCTSELEQSAAAQFAKQGIQLKIKQKHFIDKSSRPETNCLLVFAIVSGEVRHTVYK